MSNLTPNAYETKKSYRWILNIPGIRPFVISRVTSEPGGKMMIEMYWTADQRWPDEPTEKAGTLKFLDGNGSVLNHFDIKFETHENLTFNLDYSDGGGMKPRVLLHGVQLSQT